MSQAINITINVLISAWSLILLIRNKVIGFNYKWNIFKYLLSDWACEGFSYWFIHFFSSRLDHFGHVIKALFRVVPDMCRNLNRLRCLNAVAFWDVIFINFFIDGRLNVFFIKDLIGHLRSLHTRVLCHHTVLCSFYLISQT